MTDLVDNLETVGIPNLTKINWNQPLVESIRLSIYGNRLPVVYPIEPGSGMPVDDEKLKLITRTPAGFKEIKSVCYVNSRMVAKVPEPKDEWTEVNLFMDVARAVERFRRTIGHLPRAGAILATVLTELGWPVHLVIKVLNTSRPTISRWIFLQQEETLTDAELDALHDSFVVGDFSYLLDFRTLAFRTKRTGLVFKKAVFLPNVAVYHFMQALWRIAYRTRGNKSGYEEMACAATLDIVIELLLRRGATALNIAKILGIQHMAVIQRNRKAQDVFGQVETTMGSPTFGSYFDGYSLSDMEEFVKKHAPSSKDLGRVLEYTSVDQRVFDEDEARMKAFLLQVRTSQPTSSHPIPVPNVSVLAGKGYPDALPELKELDALPGYAVASYLDKMPFQYLPVSPNLYKSNQEALIDFYQDANDPPAGVHPLVNSSVAILGFDGIRSHYGAVVRPDKWKNGTLLTEHMLLQATMQYDRQKHGEGYGTTTYHWVPEEILDRIMISTEDHARHYMDSLPRSTPDSGERSQITVDYIRRFFPKHHLDLIDTWLEESDKRKAKDDNEKSLLWKCFYNPAEILDKYPAPTTRGVRS
ncbi:hypothetical protein SEA_SIXAMA_63 [Gordonia phage Sixama]|uniref:Uncharacterized protein n=1 Tax=Gordonia phage Sixama TaxID=2653271 RepID=A0A5Q2F0H4_9CAUD|nr:hypothetical protein PP302_gp063 [Gordonia phage Sixama]QGF20242.1 hypothetical protein SEA_SIXAMA_63 [Gordonia phage Sixama]